MKFDIKKNIRILIRMFNQLYCSNFLTNIRKTRTIIACNYKDSLYNDHRNLIIQKIYLIVCVRGLQLLSNPKQVLNKILQAKL